MIEKEIVIDFVPRSQLLPFHKRKQRWACLICHRRCGKTFATLMDLMLHALRKPNGRYAYIAPLYNQAKTVAWDVLKGFTRPVLRGSPNEAELRVDLIGGKAKLLGMLVRYRYSFAFRHPRLQNRGCLLRCLVSRRTLELMIMFLRKLGPVHGIGYAPQ